MNVKVSEHELADRRAHWRAPVETQLGGLLEKYVLSVRSASVGAVTHSGGVVWPDETIDGQ
jgi:dihydroxy-acid dehydratase